MIETGHILQNLGGLVSKFGLKVNSNVKKKKIELMTLDLHFKKLHQICGVWIRKV